MKDNNLKANVSTGNGKAALISVSNQDGLLEFARGLIELGFTLYATGRTQAFLKEGQVATESVEQYTGHKEILDGRVKTLHPKIHGGILAKRGNPEHLRTVAASDIVLFDVVAVNLYPFQAMRNFDDLEASVEYIDVGGPSMLRAASKNFASVFAVVDPQDYGAVLETLSRFNSEADESLSFRQMLAAKVFRHLSQYDSDIAKFLESTRRPEGDGIQNSGAGVERQELNKLALLGPFLNLSLKRQQTLRYGENPAQNAALYSIVGAEEQGFEKLQGEELSYNNLLDVDAALAILERLRGSDLVRHGESAAVIIKHGNPCGLAVSATQKEALGLSKLCDPRSHFGGVLGFTSTVDLATAKNVREDFAEVVIAPNFDEDALEVLSSSKRLRVLKITEAKSNSIELRSIRGGILLQECDSQISSASQWQQVAGNTPSPATLADLELAWRVASVVRSNAIALINDKMLVGVGAGQMSRIDSVEVAIWKARTHGHNLKGSVAASDAFFPFPDGVETLAAAGVAAIVAPKGSKKDSEVAAAAKNAGVALFWTGDRHFRH